MSNEETVKSKVSFAARMAAAKAAKAVKVEKAPVEEVKSSTNKDAAADINAVLAPEPLIDLTVGEDVLAGELKELFSAIKQGDDLQPATWETLKNLGWAQVEEPVAEVPAQKKKAGAPAKKKAAPAPRKVRTLVFKALPKKDEKIAPQLLLIVNALKTLKKGTVAELAAAVSKSLETKQPAEKVVGFYVSKMVASGFATIKDDVK